MSYTTVDNVSQALNNVEITSSTAITDSTVEQWISEAESRINNASSRTYGTVLFDNKVFDYDGSGFVKTPYFPLVSISLLEYNKYSVGSGQSEWVSLSEGRSGDFILHSDDGEIELLSSIPSGSQRLRLSGVAGYTEVPSFIIELATAMVAKRFIEAVVTGSSATEGGSVSVGNISVKDPTTFGIDNLKKFENTIELLWDAIPKGFSPRVNRIYSWKRYF